MHDFRRLLVWQHARTLARDVDRATRSFPRTDHQVVASQLRRSALSIGANIAEGCGKASRSEAIRFLKIAAGSAAETEHHLVVATDFEYLHPRLSGDLTGRAVAVQRMLHALIRNFPK